jgi:predicted metal-binding protein
MYGCGEYGQTASCPPNVPSVSECEKFFREYTEAAIFHFEKRVDKPEDRHAWTKRVNTKLSKLERKIFHLVTRGFFSCSWTAATSARSEGHEPRDSSIPKELTTR